jgi:hypothetical protein
VDGICGIPPPPPISSFLQKLNAVGRDGFASPLNISPNARSRTEFAKIGAKALNGKPAIVVPITQGLENAVPFHVAAARYAAIVLASMDVTQMFANSKITRGDILLFDINVLTPNFICSAPRIQFPSPDSTSSVKVLAKRPGTSGFVRPL